MPDITARGIVSTSGYTKPATKKAAYNGVTLYSLIDWRGTIELGGVTIPDNLIINEKGMEWTEPPNVEFFFVPDIPGHLLGELTVAPVFSKFGVKLHDNAQLFANGLVRRSPALAMQEGKFVEMGSGEVRSQGFDILLPDESYVIIAGEMHIFVQSSVTGTLKYVERLSQPIFKMLVKHGEPRPFVACAVFQMSFGNLMGLTIDESRRLRCINITVADRLLKKVYRRSFGDNSAQLQ